MNEVVITKMSERSVTIKQGEQSITLSADEVAQLYFAMREMPAKPLKDVDKK